MVNLINISKIKKKNSIFFQETESSTWTINREKIHLVSSVLHTKWKLSCVQKKQLLFFICGISWQVLFHKKNSCTYLDDKYRYPNNKPFNRSSALNCYHNLIMIKLNLDMNKASWIFFLFAVTTFLLPPFFFIKESFGILFDWLVWSLGRQNPYILHEA